MVCIVEERTITFNLGANLKGGKNINNKKANNSNKRERKKEKKREKGENERKKANESAFIALEFG